MRNALPFIEPLEARIAPAITLSNPIPDITAGLGKIGVTLDLGAAFVVDGSFRSHVRFNTNYIDPANPTVPQFIDIELFDDKAPLSVDNFLRYVQGIGPSSYDGTFFNRAVTNFVLQGGGINVGNLNSHMPTLPPVHTEFRSGDAETSNTAGTLAFAQGDGEPNSGSSDFFFNLADNSANLDVQNGGFTVFGKVVHGMNVVNAIAALPRAGTAPVQNYNADPDNNALTPPPTPTPAQLIQISHGQVLPPVNYEAAGVSYSIDSIVDSVTNQPTDLLGVQLSGDALKLAFKTGASGVAKVTVRATKVGEADVTDTFLVTVKPNLLVDVRGDSLTSVIVPGDKGTVDVRLTNSAATVLKGKVDVRVFYTNGTDPAVLLGTTPAQMLSLASAQTKIVSVKVSIPQELATTNGQNYQIIAEVVPSDGLPLNELFTDDNAARGKVHGLFNAFGTFVTGGVTRKDVPLSFHDSAGKLVTLTLKGGGIGQLVPHAGTAFNLVVNDSTAKSNLALVTEKGAAVYPLNDVIIQRSTGTTISPLASLDLHSTTITGNVIAQDGVKKMLLGDVTGGTTAQTIQIGVFAKAGDASTAITTGVLRDVTIFSLMPITTFTATAYLDSDTTHEAFGAPSIVNLKITGNANIPGDFMPELTLKDATVKLNTFTVAGSLSNSIVVVPANVGTVKLGAMVGSTFAAGATVFPSGLNDFAGVRRTISSFSISAFNGAFAASNVIAAQIGKFSVPGVADGTATAAFGVYADRITSYQRGTLKLAKLDAAGTFDTNGFYKITIV